MKKLILVALSGVLLSGLGACHRSANKGAGPTASSNDESDPEARKREAQALVDKGKELFYNNQDSEALKTLQQAVKLDPENAEANFRLGLALNTEDQVEDAKDALKKSIDLYKKALEADPKNAEAFFNMGEAYRVLHRDEEAAQAYRQAIHLKPDDEEAYYQLGKSQTRLARYAEAAVAFQKAQDLDPNDSRVSDALDDAHEGAQRIKEGKKHQEDMLKKQDNANKNANAATPAVKPSTNLHP